MKKSKPQKEKKSMSGNHQAPYLNRKVGGKQKILRRSRLQLIDLADIRPDPENRTIDLTDPNHRRVQEAISNRGLLEPIMVTERGDGGYDLLDGHLRFEAMKEEGADSVEAIIRPGPPSEKQRRADQIMFNSPSARKPFERAAEVERLVDACDGDQAEAGELINLPRQTVNKYMALSRIDPKVRAELERFNLDQENKGKQPLTFNHTYEIALAKTTSEQKRLAGLAMGGATTKMLAAERKQGSPTPDSERGKKRDGKKPVTVKKANSPLLEVPLGDYRAMKLKQVQWKPDSADELKQCIAVANRLSTLRPNLDDENWPKQGIRMTWKGKVNNKGEVRFQRHDGRVYLQLRETKAILRRKALLISAIYLGDTQQTWN